MQIIKDYRVFNYKWNMYIIVLPPKAQRTSQTRMPEPETESCGIISSGRAWVSVVKSTVAAYTRVRHLTFC